MRANLIAGIGLAAVAAFFAAGLPSIDDQAGYSGLSPRFLPQIVTFGLAACALMLLLRRHSVPAQAEDAATAVERERGPGRLALVAGGLLLHMALIGTLGFVLAGVLLMSLVARGYGSTRTLRDALVGLAITVPIWLLFTQLLGISLKLLPLAGL